MSTTSVPQLLPTPTLSERAFGRLHGLVRGRSGDAPWVRPALIVLLVGTAVAYVWNLSASGYANGFYAAAVQAGAKSWKALFFGSLDSSSFITVDKPPASIWVMALSGRIFGFSSLSMLIPQALEGVAAVALLYAGVRRWFGAGAGLLASVVMAITPVAALMFRFNNPDALLVGLLVAAGYCLIRALERASTRWVLTAGTMLGFAFLAKMLQAFLVLPAFALVYMVAAPTGLRRRAWQTFAGGLAIVLSAGWWVAIVALWPTGSRPMIDGSPTNNIFNLITGYNGLGRIFGATGPAAGGGAGGNFSGQPGMLRLFNNLMGGQASWLLPAALLALLIGLWSTRRAPRTDRTRAALLLWGGWLIVSGLTFSLASGIIHPYYTLALAPAIAALVAISARELWRARHQTTARFLLALGVTATAAWAWVLLDRTPQWESWLRPLIALSAALAIAGLLAAPALRRFGRRTTYATAAVTLIACLSGPAAYTAQTITTPETGALASAGPSSAQNAGGPGGPGGPGPPGPPGGNRSGGLQRTTSTALVKALQRGSTKYRWVAAVSGSQTAASLELATGGAPVMAIGGFDGQGGNLTLAQFKQYVARGQIHYYIPGGTDGGGGFFTGAPPMGSGGGFFTGAPPMGSGGQPAGFPGAGGGSFTGPRPGGSSSAIAITSWVSAHYKSETIGGQGVYNLTQAVR
ncbi:MAG TPA: glycosyltransferase family 39 protein [Solirubrobacteraceae bacterium]